VKYLKMIGFAAVAPFIMLIVALTFPLLVLAMIGSRGRYGSEEIDRLMAWPFR
jgi:hypothetical protein